MPLCPYPARAEGLVNKDILFVTNRSVRIFQKRFLCKCDVVYIGRAFRYQNLWAHLFSYSHKYFELLCCVERSKPTFRHCSSFIGSPGLHNRLYLHHVMALCHFWSKRLVNYYISPYFPPWSYITMNSTCQYWKPFWFWNINQNYRNNSKNCFHSAISLDHGIQHNYPRQTLTAYISFLSFFFIFSSLFLAFSRSLPKI